MGWVHIVQHCTRKERSFYQDAILMETKSDECEISINMPGHKSAISEHERRQELDHTQDNSNKSQVVDKEQDQKVYSLTNIKTREPGPKGKYRLSLKNTNSSESSTRGRVVKGVTFDTSIGDTENSANITNDIVGEHNKFIMRSKRP
eukprot:gnl/Chilomastix_caulleri/1678.p1 GENE.gnl/Chilomastix_caulleri/1678~~gnl/Chilomastix_caulleri/1678.p1  ORF type:complete len:147 (+),score=26.43 gnl/Chilomastix_caulleri/1678:75-515(+)